jgi:DNA-binding Xre family transcriptional regulator
MIVDLQPLNPLELLSVSLEKRSQLPVTSGIYFVIDTQNEVRYIGKAINLRERWRNHKILKNGLLQWRIAWFDLSKEQLDIFESKLICKYCPDLNKLYPFKVSPGRIKEIRHQQGIQQQKLAEALNWAPSYLSVVERGGKSIPLQTLNQLCKALNCNPGDLLKFEPD